jgi:hypothetical protein
LQAFVFWNSGSPGDLNDLKMSILSVAKAARRYLKPPVRNCPARTHCVAAAACKWIELLRQRVSHRNLLMWLQLLTIPHVTCSCAWCLQVPIEDNLLLRDGTDEVTHTAANADSCIDAARANKRLGESCFSVTGACCSSQRSRWPAFIVPQ